MAKKKRTNTTTREQAIECQTALHGDEVMWEIQKHGYFTNDGVVSCISAKDIGKLIGLCSSSVINIIQGLINEGRLKRIEGKRAAFFIEYRYLT